MKKLILVEDSKEIFTLVKQAIGFMADITWVETIELARLELKNKEFDLVLLDVELPDGNGIEFCSEIQSKSPMLPIFILTSHSDLSDKVLGFSAGADDYIVKPFNPLELKARIEAKFRKTDIVKDLSDHLSWNELQIDKSSQEVRILNNDKFEVVELTALEFKLLMYFATRFNKVISRDDILNDIWGEDVHVYARSVDTHVSKLRKKLGPVSHIIESIHGAGYKFMPQSNS
jgi:DNA-binding response OmpR family regulator